MGCATCCKCNEVGNFMQCPKCGSRNIAFDEDFNDYDDEGDEE